MILNALEASSKYLRYLVCVNRTEKFMHIYSKQFTKELLKVITWIIIITKKKTCKIQLYNLTLRDKRLSYLVSSSYEPSWRTVLENRARYSAIMTIRNDPGALLIDRGTGFSTVIGDASPDFAREPIHLLNCQTRASITRSRNAARNVRRETGDSKYGEHDVRRDTRPAGTDEA